MLQQTSNKCVLSICDISPTRCGSFEEFLISLTEELRERKIAHTIVFREKPIKSVEKALLGKGAEIKIFMPSKFSVCNLYPLYKIIKETKPELVHFHFYPIYTIINYLGFILKVKIVYTDHMGHKEANTLLKKMIRRIYYYTNSRFFDFGIEKIVCVSNFVKEKYRREYGIDSKKLQVIYNGINIERFRKINNCGKIKEKYNITDEFVVTSVGLRKEKGIHCLINAAPIIIKATPRTKFFLVGEDKSRSDLEEYIDKLSMRKHFIFTGNTNYIEKIYNISSCVAVPTLVDEAFCFVAAEAMSTETPIVAFDSGALKEVVYNEFQVVPKNYTLLADRIIEILINGDIYDKNEMRNHVIKNFPLEKCVNEYILLYKQLSVVNMSY